MNIKPSGKPSAILSVVYSRTRSTSSNSTLRAERAEREGDYARVAEIRYSSITAKEKENLEMQGATQDDAGRKALIKEEVDAEDIADVVSRWTGIPVSKMIQSEKEKLLHLKPSSTTALSDRRRPSAQSPTPCAAAEQASTTRAVL